MKLTEETIHGIASEHWITIVNPTRYALASTDFARAIESTVRQDAEAMVRELVEALKHARGYSPVIAVAITRAQHWLGNI